MKKIFLASALSLSVSGVFAQGIQDKIKDETCKTLEKDLVSAEKKTSDPKKGAKASTWMDLAKVYMDITTTPCKDSMSSTKVYETYKKAEEIDKTAGGKMAKEIGDALKSDNLYRAMMSQGAAYYNGKSLVNAIKLFKLASTVNPKDTLAALYTGIASQQAKDIETSKNAFANFIDLGGKDPAVFYSLAQIYKNEKNTTKAIETLKKGIAINPNDKDLKGEMVNTNLAGGNTEAAIEDLKKLVDSDPKNATNMLNLAILYDNSNKKDIAMGYYKKVMELDPNNYDCNYNLGVFYFNQAVEMKKAVDKMDMKTYQKEGKAIEEKVCAKFSESKPFFDKCKSIKPNEEEVNSNLTNLQGVLDQCGKRK
jgi:tetratricopeptide (TPR) repeat protein